MSKEKEGIGNTSHQLILDEDALHQCKLEKREEFSKSYFYAAFRQAIAVVQEIAQASYRTEHEVDSANNIIAFEGERGTGKTSVMLSFMYALNEGLPGLEQTKFHNLSVIKPAFMAKDTLLELVLASMLSQWIEKREGNQLQQNTRDKESELLRQFDLVYRGIGILHEQTAERDVRSINELRLSAETVRLKANFARLVRLYLNILAGQDENQFLVIAIDDIDAESTNGDDMFEEIDRYLMMPHVLILMTLRISQMQLLLHNRVAKRFHPLYQHYLFRNKLANTTEIAHDLLMQLEGVGIQYLEKLIPFTHRVSMPNLQSEDFLVQESYNDQRGKEAIAGSSLKDFLGKLLNRNTDYIIYTDSNYEGIAPRTLRHLVELTSTLLMPQKMYEDPVWFESKDSALMQLLIESSESIRGSKILRSILAEMQHIQMTALNHYLLIRVCSYLNKSETIYNNQRWYEFVEHVWEHRNYIRLNNVKVKDVLFLLKVALECCDSKNDRSLLELIKVGYSLRLLRISDDDQIKTMYSDDIVGMYFYGINNPIFSRLYCTFVTNDSQTQKELSDILEVVPEAVVRDNENYSPTLMRDIYFQEIDLENKEDVCRFVPFRILLDVDAISDDLRKLMGNLDVYMQWLDNINKSMQDVFNQKGLKARLKNVGWCLEILYKSAIEASKEMRKKGELPAGIDHAIMMCEKQMEKILNKLKKMKIEIVQNNDKTFSERGYVLFKAIRQKKRQESITDD